MIAAAILHDVVEDTPATHAEVAERFGAVVGELVEWLSDVSRPENGNRAMRKALDRDHIALAPPQAKTIKLADLISNTRSILAHDPGFACIYLREKMLLLEVLGEGDPGLLATAKALARHGLAQLGA